MEPATPDTTRLRPMRPAFSVSPCTHKHLLACTLKLSPVKPAQSAFVHNFGKCRAISKIVSLLNSARNLQHDRYISHCTLNMSLPCLEKYEISKNSKILLLRQQRPFTSKFHEINKQKQCRWMIWNELYAESVVLSHGRLSCMSSMSLCFKHINSTLIQCLGVMKFSLLDSLAAPLIIQY